MTNTWEKVAAASSVVLRISVFTFLRWIPGHHFPRTIVAALIVYLYVVFAKSNAFGSSRPSLREAFPKLFTRNKISRANLTTEELEEKEIGYDDPALYDDEHPYLKTLLLGIPDWRELDFSYLTIGTNILLTLLTLDLVFRGPVFHPAHDLRFSRVGYVDSTYARILVREPDTKQLPIYAYYKTEAELRWKEFDRVWSLGVDTDYTYGFNLSSLQPETKYVYSLSNDLSGSFQTAPSRTSPHSGELTFLTTSCIKANFPYRLFSHSLAIHGLEYLSKIAQSLSSKPAFMMFLGDFIYVDVPQRLGRSMAHYRSEYRRVYASPSWDLPGISTIPWLHTLDDHEIANDWSGGNDTEPFPSASDPFIHYHVSVNPPTPPGIPSALEQNQTYFQFTRGPASFFMLDTRRYRTDPEPKLAGNKPVSAKPLYASSPDSPSNPPTDSSGTKQSSSASMLGQPQLDSLLRFITTPEPRNVHWKIIVSSVPFTKNWRFGTSDTWGGFLSERTRILKAMHRAESTLGIRIIILSGDRHEFAAIRYPPTLSATPPITLQQQESTPDQTPIIQSDQQFDTNPHSGPHEFSCGPLSMFYLPLRTFKQIDDEDVSIAYFPDGNSKVGVVEIRNLVSTASPVSGSKNLVKKKKKTGKSGGNLVGGVGINGGNDDEEEAGQRSLFKYSLYVDGVVEWEYTLTSPGY